MKIIWKTIAPVGAYEHFTKLKWKNQLNFINKNISGCDS